MAPETSEEDSASAPDAEAAPTPEPAYSAFGPWQKRWIVFLAAFASLFSPMSSFIFYPAIKSIATSLGVTVGLINLAVTTYMVVSGVVPALLGNAADKFGRRPIYLLALLIYFAANLGLSLQNTYAGLLVLRMLQSAGSSGTISLGYGVLSDLTTRAERGSYVGLLLVGPNVAPSLGPVLGGVVAAKLGWKWIFWLLCILGGVCLVLVLLALPETSRVIVGNGSIPATGIYRTLTSILTEWRNGHGKTEKANEAPILERTTSRSLLPSPIDCLKLFLLGDVAMVLVCNAIYYTIYCCIQASLSTLFIEVYGYKSLEAGLIYLPFGVACLIGNFIWGRVLDSEFARVSKDYGVSADPVREHGAIVEFPVEKARLRSALFLVVASALATIGYGWTVHYHLHVAAPLAMQAIIGFTGTGLFVAFGTLLTDLNAERASTAAASANLVRCALAAAALAVLEYIIDGVGVGWCFTIFGLLGGLCVPLMVWGIRCGGRLRQKRQAAMA